MKGFAAFFLGCVLVYALAIIAAHDPNVARWIGLSILAVLFVGSALPRRVERTRR